MLVNYLSFPFIYYSYSEKVILMIVQILLMSMCVSPTRTQRVHEGVHYPVTARAVAAAISPGTSLATNSCKVSDQWSRDRNMEACFSLCRTSLAMPVDIWARQQQGRFGPTRTGTTCTGRNVLSRTGFQTVYIQQCF